MNLNPIKSQMPWSWEFAREEVERAVRRYLVGNAPKMERILNVLDESGIEVVRQESFTLVIILLNHYRFYGMSKANPNDAYCPNIGVSLAAFRAAKRLVEFYRGDF